MIKRILYLLLLVLTVFVISYIAVYKWFSSETILYYWDSYIPFNDDVSLRNFYTWQSIIFPGASGIALSWQLYLFCIESVKWLTGSLSKSQETLYILSITYSVISFYFLAKELLHIVTSKVNKFLIETISIFFGLAYTLNLYTYYYSYFMFNPQIYLYASLPIHILSIFKLFPLDVERNKKYFGIWLIAFYATSFIMIPGFTSYIFFAEYLLILVSYIMVWLLIRVKKQNKIQVFVPIILFFLSIIAIHAIWFGPSLLSFRQLYESQRGLGTDIYIELSSGNNNLLNSLRLIGSPMMNNNTFSWTPFYLENPLFTFPLFLFLLGGVFVFLYFSKIRIKITVAFLAIIFLITVFIVKLGNPPFKWLIELAFRYVPFFGAFRESFQKAGMYYIVSYYALSAIGIYLFLVNFEKKRKIIVYTISIVFLLLTLVVQTGPFFLFAKNNIKTIDFEYNNKQYTFSAKTKIPQAYTDLKKFMQPSCNERVTLVVPRTGLLSSGTWEKEGYSYIGQDMLTRLINCSFISIHTMQNDPDAFTTAPYLMLQRGEYSDFKAFLQRNSIQWVLIRKDYVPYYYTQWFTVDPVLVAQKLNEDFDYRKIYDNEYFSLYELSQQPNAQFGFSFISKVIYSNVSIRESKQFYETSSFLPELYNPVILSDSPLVKQFKSKILGFISIANCVGCIKINMKSILDDDLHDFFADTKKTIKNIVRPILGIRTRNYSEAEEISLAIIEMNDVFLKIKEQLKNPDRDKSRSLAKTYEAKLKNIQKQVMDMEGGFFDKNQKYIEFNNYLQIEYGWLMDILRQIRGDKKFESMQLREIFFELLMYQRQIIDDMENKLWVTEHKNGQLNMRLDVSSSQEYRCKAMSYNSGIELNSIHGGGFLQEPIQENVPITRFLNEGSYPITLSYKAKTITSLPALSLSSSLGSEISLGHLESGNYSISLDQNPGNGLAYLVVSSKKLDFENASKETLLTDVDNFVFLLPISTEFNELSIWYDFSVFTLDKSEYFLYIIPFNWTNDGINIFEYSNINIRHTPRTDDIQFVCASTNIRTSSNNLPQFTIEKKSSVKYIIKLTKEYTDTFLTFNQSYHPDWQAYTIINGKKHIFQHVKNTYANAWYIDVADVSEITIEFLQQHIVMRLLFGSIVMFIVTSIGYYIYEKNHKTH